MGPNVSCLPCEPMSAIPERFYEGECHRVPPSAKETGNRGSTPVVMQFHRQHQSNSWKRVDAALPGKTKMERAMPGEPRLGKQQCNQTSPVPSGDPQNGAKQRPAYKFRTWAEAARYRRAQCICELYTFVKVENVKSCDCSRIRAFRLSRASTGESVADRMIAAHFSWGSSADLASCSAVGLLVPGRRRGNGRGKGCRWQWQAV